jgi:hypothetical protein
MGEASRLMRLTLGEPSERLETVPSEGAQPDYSTLTDEELDTLRRVRMKPHGGRWIVRTVRTIRARSILN